VNRHRITLLAAAALLVVAAAPASAQWTRVTELPATNMFSVWANGDTLVAGSDSLVFVSTNAGLTWHTSTKVTKGVTSVQTARLRNGRLYAGTFGQGVFVSDNLGTTWQGFNQGLVGGIFDSQLDVTNLEIRGDSIYASTQGAGVYERGFAPTEIWSQFGDAFETNEDPNVNAVVVGGSRLLACAGGNGFVYRRDPGEGEWTQSPLDNVGLHPGLGAVSAAYTGTGWVVGTQVGVFRSALGQEPWFFTDFRSEVGLRFITFATRPGRLFAAFAVLQDAEIKTSGDEGATWQDLETFPSVFVSRLAMSGSVLYAARSDGLWRRQTADVSVPGRVPVTGLRFALGGPQPVGDDVRFRFELPASGSTVIELFNVAGRRVMEPLRGSWSAGAHEVSWNAGGLGPGIYEARLTFAGRHEVVRLVRVRQ
jgi:hypothetical protein